MMFLPECKHTPVFARREEAPRIHAVDLSPDRVHCELSPKPSISAIARRLLSASSQSKTMWCYLKIVFSQLGGLEQTYVRGLAESLLKLNPSFQTSN